MPSPARASSFFGSSFRSDDWKYVCGSQAKNAPAGFKINTDETYQFAFFVIVKLVNRGKFSKIIFVALLRSTLTPTNLSRLLLPSIPICCE